MAGDALRCGKPETVLADLLGCASGFYCSCVRWSGDWLARLEAGWTKAHQQTAGKIGRGSRCDDQWDGRALTGSGKDRAGPDRAGQGSAGHSRQVSGQAGGQSERVIRQGRAG